MWRAEGSLQEIVIHRVSLRLTGKYLYHLADLEKGKYFNVYREGQVRKHSVCYFLKHPMRAVTSMSGKEFLIIFIFGLLSEYQKKNIPQPTL